MERLTKRNKDGGVGLNTDSALERLAQYEDSGLEPIEYMDIKMQFDRIYSMPNCNDCGNRDCGYKPALGELIRYNCPFWEERNWEKEVWDNPPAKDS